jgi:hypothetical protein
VLLLSVMMMMMMMIIDLSRWGAAAGNRLV